MVAPATNRWLWTPRTAPANGGTELIGTAVAASPTGAAVFAVATDPTGNAQGAVTVA